MGFEMNVPLVSVGVPVYNEERFIANTLNSLLAQDYPNLEIIISDNASTDATADICKSYAGKDSRVHVHAFAENQGSHTNFQRALDKSRGEFFIWVGGHDLLDPGHISACTKELLEHPDAVLCTGEYPEIDEFGNYVKTIPVRVDTAGLSPAKRFQTILRDPGTCFAFYSLMRANHLKALGPITERGGSDLQIIARLSLIGEFRFVPAARTYIRAFRHRGYEEDQNALHILSPAFANSAAGKRFRRFPNLQYAAGMLRILWGSKLTAGEKIRLSTELFSLTRKSLFKEIFIRSIPQKIRSSIRKYRNVSP